MRVLVVDDHAVFRDGLTAILESIPDTEVVGTAGDGETAVEAATVLAPDVVLMDLHMPVVDGIEATRRIIAARPDTAVLVLTMLTDDRSVFEALAAGARGYLLKESGRDDLRRALDAVSAGQGILDTAVAVRVLGTGRRPALGPDEDDPRFPELTPREREIVDLVARGLTNSAIAERLYLSEKTVRNHVSNVFTKLRVSDRAAAVAVARDAGFGARHR